MTEYDCAEANRRASDPERVGRALKLLRAHVGITQVELARRLGLASRTPVTMTEGGRASITLCTLERYASALGVHMTMVLAYATDIEYFEASAPLADEDDSQLGSTG